MKKKTVLGIALCVAASISAANKKHTLVIMGNTTPHSGHTEVTIRSEDTLEVKPSVNINSIVFSLKDAAGNVIEEHIAPAQAQSTLTLIAPELPTGYFLEVRDPRGVVYQEFKYQ